MSDIIQFDYKKHWTEEEIIFEKPRSGDKSLGFTIVGGIDEPFRHRHFTSIIITNVNEKNLSHRNKPLEVYDVILRMNSIDFTNIKHQNAVQALKESGPIVKLLIRRLSLSNSEEIELEHNGKLGFTIVGGLGQEYFQDDHGIFITNILNYQTKKQLDIGDRLLQISSMFNTYDLRFVTHEMAKQYIALACKESKTIKLYVGHTRPNVGTQVSMNLIQLEKHGWTKCSPFVFNRQNQKTNLHQRRQDLLASKYEDATETKDFNSSMVSSKNQSTQADYHNRLYSTIGTSTEELIVPFDFEDCERYERRNKVHKNRLLNDQSIKLTKVLSPIQQEQPTTIRSTLSTTTTELKSNHEANTDIEQLETTIRREHVKLNGTSQGPSIDQRSIQQQKLNQAVILEAKAEKQRRQESKVAQKARLARQGITTDGYSALRWQFD
ncbi:unnamed protein product [Rotaria socialis]|uniref:PDZ domain-containing protein n=1 Tax=Rotaria socialis TaxID=392032 RepID=A0A818R598_9BILA|nr:unnamed protein product [Rotaria socialis]CAF3335598.1 unnamed protein product [Rotaria socialis]CAF3651500.1 unnamed protein product [Rotaria socialis]CAF4137170.1 unnamed protein product [Rotaria socialis]CAF4170557.1 unnamed protein product [Rotaria socialis]